MGLFPRNPNVDTNLQTNVLGTVYGQEYVAHVVWDDPAAADEDGSDLGSVETSAAGTTAVDVSSITQPDVPRNVVINPSDLGTTTDGKAGDITITGTAIDGSVISEAIAVVDNQAHDTLSAGLAAFASITAISILIQDGADAEYYVGYGDVLGLPYTRAILPCLAAYLNEALEGTAPTIVADASDIENNTIELNSALDTNQVDAYLVV